MNYINLVSKHIKIRQISFIIKFETILSLIVMFKDQFNNKIFFKDQFDIKLQRLGINLLLRVNLSLSCL